MYIVIVTALIYRDCSFVYQKFEDSSFLMEFGCYKVQQLHLVFTWRDRRSTSSRLTC